MSRAVYHYNTILSLSREDRPVFVNMLTDEDKKNLLEMCIAISARVKDDLNAAMEDVYQFEKELNDLNQIYDALKNRNIEK